MPAVTEMLYAIGAGDQVVAVSSFDRYPPAVEKLPKVGALLDPNTERMLSLKPDMVVIYGSQSDLQAQLARTGTRTFIYRHGGLRDALAAIEAIGSATGHASRAATVVQRIRGELAAVAERVKDRPKPRTLLVFGREPGTLRSLYASGGVGFLDDLLGMAGARNVFEDVKRESVQPSQETLLARAPDVIVELHPSSGLDAANVGRIWAPLASIPAVRTGRVHALTGAHLVVAGPRLGAAAEALARAVHPGAWPDAVPTRLLP